MDKPRVLILASTDFGGALGQFFKQNDIDVVILPSQATLHMAEKALHENPGPTVSVLETEGRSNVTILFELLKQRSQKVIIATPLRGDAFRKQAEVFYALGALAVLPNDSLCFVFFREAVYRLRVNRIYAMPPAALEQVFSKHPVAKKPAVVAVPRPTARATPADDEEGDVPVANLEIQPGRGDVRVLLAEVAQDLTKANDSPAREDAEGKNHHSLRSAKVPPPQKRREHPPKMPKGNGSAEMVSPGTAALAEVERAPLAEIPCHISDNHLPSGEHTVPPLDSEAARFDGRLITREDISALGPALESFMSDLGEQAAGVCQAIDEHYELLRGLRAKLVAIQASAQAHIDKIDSHLERKTGERTSPDQSSAQRKRSVHRKQASTSPSSKSGNDMEQVHFLDQIIPLSQKGALYLNTLQAKPGKVISREKLEQLLGSRPAVYQSVTECRRAIERVFGEKADIVLEAFVTHRGKGYSYEPERLRSD